MRPYNSRLGGGNTGPHNHQRERERERERERKGGREREGWMKERGREGERERGRDYFAEAQRAQDRKGYRP
jgi:hypothetical protein